MSEQNPPYPVPGPPARRPDAGVPAVEAVLASLEQLDGAPLAEHVAVFEAAHEQLRSALADAGDTGPAPTRR